MGSLKYFNAEKTLFSLNGDGAASIVSITGSPNRHSHRRVKRGERTGIIVELGLFYKKCLGITGRL